MFQTRDEFGALLEFSTFKEALQAAKSNPDIWKISFAVGDERIRLTRDINGHFVLDQMEDAIARIEAEHATQ